MKDGIILEVCIENGTRIDGLIAGGADRVELCDNLAVGGTTVSYGVAENVIRRCHGAGPCGGAGSRPEKPIQVMSMVRPRGGNFVYDENEFSVMLRDLEILKGLGTDGVVFGCLDAAGSLDREKTLRLVKAACGLVTVFHMAFDHINAEEQCDSLRWLAGNGITRILTHGSPDLTVPIEKNVPRLREYTGLDTGVEILAGGGVTKDNYRELCGVLGIHQVHGTSVL